MKRTILIICVLSLALSVTSYGATGAVDCEFPDGTPVIKSVSAPNNGFGGGRRLLGGIA